MKINIELTCHEYICKLVRLILSQPLRTFRAFFGIILEAPGEYLFEKNVYKLEISQRSCNLFRMNNTNTGGQLLLLTDLVNEI